MKKNIILAALAALALTSCIGDLEQYPLSDTAVPADKVYGDPAYRKSALAKIYGSFTLIGQGGPGSPDIAVSDGGASEFLRALWSVQEISADAVKCVWGDSWVKEINTNTWTSTKNDAIFALYNRAMMMISFSNDFLRNTTDADPEIATERAEVRFLRAYAYWVLLDTFGNPPFVDETAPMDGYLPKQILAKDLYAWIENELTALLSDASPMKAIRTQTYPRIDKGAAHGLLARIYLNHKTYLGTENKAIYTKAMEAADQVIAAYPLAKNYATLFNGDNGENPAANCEFVFATCYDGTKTQSYGGTTYFIVAGYSGRPSTWKEDVDGPWFILGCGDGWAGLTMPAQYISNFGINVDAAKVGEKPDPAWLQRDARSLVSLRLSDAKDVNGKDFTAGWHCEKFNNNWATAPGVDQSAKGIFSSIDFPLIRSGEMYLIYAEAAKRAAQNEAKGLGYLKQLRQRAGLDASQMSGYTLDDVFREISCELMWEAQRRTTLIRFGRYHTDTYLWALKGNVKTGRAFASYMLLFPIPGEDLTSNSNLVQNPGYSK